MKIINISTVTTGNLTFIEMWKLESSGYIDVVYYEVISYCPTTQISNLVFHIKNILNTFKLNSKQLFTVFKTSNVINVNINVTTPEDEYIITQYNSAQ